MLALQALCVLDALGDDFLAQLDQFLGDAQTHADLGFRRPPAAEIAAFARRLVEGTWRGRQRYDELLTQTAASWSVARMPPVDRAILRLGLYELLEESDVPPEVAITEAIKLARRFADRDSPAFVNGVLDAIRRKLGIPTGAQQEHEPCHGTF